MPGNLRQRLAADVAALGLPSGPARPAPVTQAELAGLPPAAQRYLRFMGVADGPPDWSFLAHMTGRFRLRPGMPWLRCEAEFRFRPGSLRYNVAPADVGAREPGGLAGAAHRMANWGATSRERSTVLPGDELVPGPASVTTLATTVEATPEEVWPWLVQIGQDRGGLYSYDWLENLFGLDIHSTRRIRDEWQHLAPGDQVRLVRKGGLGLKEGFALPVARVDPGRAIVLREQPPAQPWEAIWSFHVVSQGPGRCRLISRGRSARPRGAARVAAWVMAPVTTVMTRKMLLGIKRRAEAGGVRPPAGTAGTRR